MCSVIPDLAPIVNYVSRDEFRRVYQYASVGVKIGLATKMTGPQHHMLWTLSNLVVGVVDDSRVDTRGGKWWNNTEGMVDDWIKVDRHMENTVGHLLTACYYLRPSLPSQRSRHTSTGV